MRVFALTLTLLLGGCAPFGSISTQPAPACTSDSDCGEGQLCFPEGCGNPGSSIVVEVTANTKSGHHAQDIALSEPNATEDINIYGPISLIGEVQRRLTPPAPVDARSSYTGAGSVRVSGESVLIPGIPRRHEVSYATLQPGAFSMFVGAGRYSVTFSPGDLTIPGETQEVVVSPESDAHVSFLLTAPGGAIQLTGRLLKLYRPEATPVEVPITQTAMEIQAVDPYDLKPLSQPASVSSGYASSNGDFVLYLSPKVDSLDTILLVARPKEGGSAVPSKTFAVRRPFPSQLILELGDFGELKQQVGGAIFGTDGKPVVGATVFLEGGVTGGGVYRSRTTVTDSSGAFKVDLLPSAANGFYVLTARPLAQGADSSGSSAAAPGILQRNVKVLSKPNAEGQYLEPHLLESPDRVPVVGTVLRPNGQPALGVRVLATPIGTIDGRPLPDPVETFTDENARYWLNLDPASYRIDYLPGEDLPLRSRIIDIRAELGTEGRGAKLVDLKEFTLANGRTVTGTVSSYDRLSGLTAPVPNGTLRFYRVTNVGGKRSALLLGQTVADERGRYSLVLPTR